MIRVNDSEIINQKKQFIFEVEQTSNYVFPNENFNYFIYIKNISGTTIDYFTIKIDNAPGVIFETKYDDSTDICIKPDEVKLYEMTAYCSMIGEHTVHFIGYGEGTQIIYRTLKINCTRTYNSDKTLHRIHIYDFTPYEEKYSMESTNYSNQVTQIFKRQKLPYKAGEQPFPLEKDFIPENIESQSFLDQYNEAKNTEEHVYQYISRENFTEDAIESYTGENLAEIFDKINKQSKYFKGKFFRSGTNHLLNDFRQYSPNGFIFRMGLLNSEIYHNLGVIPTYTYMSDYLFRWAPAEKQLLNLIPKKKAMKWGENIWAGRGWIVYRSITPEYSKTEEFEKLVEEKAIVRREIVGSYEEKWTAEELVNKLKKADEIQRMKQKSDIVKYEYNIYESLYDTGVFFVNIPIDKIPTNFYLLNNESLYSLINRTKPYGTKPIVNYIIERTFNHHIDQKLNLNYHKNFVFESDPPSINHKDIIQSEYVIKTEECEGTTITYPALVPKRVVLTNSFYQNQDMNVEVDYSQIGMTKNIEHDMSEETYIYETKADHKLKTLEDILETLYQGNYNTLCFRMDPKDYSRLDLTEEDVLFSEDEDEHIILKKAIESLKLKIPNTNDFKKGDTENYMQIEDIYNRKHKVSVKYDTLKEMCYIKYTYINTKNKEYVRQKGYQDINSIIVIIGRIGNKKILLFMVEDSKNYMHYFHHVIVQDILSFDTNQFKSISYANNLFNKEVTFETPFVNKSEVYQPEKIKGGNNWTNMYRLNEKANSYAYIKNITNDYLLPNDITLVYDQINIPETAIITQLRLKLIGNNSVSNKVYVSDSFNTNYLTEDVSGYNIQLTPNKIECYSHLRKSSVYYQTKLDIALIKDQKTFIEKFTKLLEENNIFNEDIGIDIEKYILEPNDYITIDNEFWYELSEFSDLTYKLNEVANINFIIEGYNTEYDAEILLETLSETENSSTVKSKIPSGYFRKKIPLLYPNEFLLELLRVRFRFNNLNHNIKIFDTKIELTFKNKQKESIEFEEINDINMNNESYIILTQDYYNASDLNNGISIKLSFDELKPGNYYHINSTELEVIYEDTDIDMMINDNKYKDVFYGINQSGVSGVLTDAYLSGTFYNDVATMSQTEDNVGIENKGIKLQDSLYQLFETRDDNITSVELFPYGFRGNPDETLKIGLYTNSYNTPGKLIKEIYVSGWVKNNSKLKSLDRIKYNFNVNNLEVNGKYWLKIQVLNPQESSYYLLKGINKSKNGFKLLSDENNNYINTFSNLKFNIYSKNLSKSFNNIPVLQDYLDNPYVVIGLHKGQGLIKKLQTDKYIKSVSGNDYMSEIFEEEPTVEVFKIIKKTEFEEDEELPITEDD